MIEEALQYLLGVGVQAEKPHVVRETEAETIVVLKGDVHRIPKAPEPRDHKLGTLEDLVALARFVAEAAADGDPIYPVVWYDAKRVVLVFNDGGLRVDRATFTLDTSDVFDRLALIRGRNEWWEQKPFVRLLRVELAGTLDPLHLLEKVRRLRWENSQTTSGQVARDRESLGRTITSQVASEEPIPEEVTLMVPVYRNPGERDRYPMRCTVDTEPTLGKLQILPLPDEVDRVREMAVDAIGERLREGLADAGVRVYRGAP